jgi:hypothetical protein
MCVTSAKEIDVAATIERTRVDLTPVAGVEQSVAGDVPPGAKS